MSLPGPSLNGGLYTGEPFAKGAPWANVPNAPDAGFLTHVALRTANPPPGATVQYVVGLRPGNNASMMEGLEYDDEHGLLLVSGSVQANAPGCRFAKYAYLR